MMRQLLLGVLLAGLALAARADEADIRKAAEAFLGPDAKVEGVTKAGFLDLYEVRITTSEGTRIIYTDERATHFIIGSVFDAKTEADLTDARLRKLNAIRFDELPLAQAFKVVRGKGTRQLAYFSDPRCPYCKRLD